MIYAISTVITSSFPTTLIFVKIERSPIRNPFFLNPPDCLYTKKSCKFFQSHEKSRAKQRNFVSFLPRRRSFLSKAIIFTDLLASTPKTYCLTSSKILFDIIKDTVWHHQRYCLTSSKIKETVWFPIISHNFFLKIYRDKKTYTPIKRTRTILVATPQVPLRPQTAPVNAADSPC